MENLVNSLDECRDGEIALEIIRQISQFFDTITESDVSKIDQHLAFAFPEEGGILDYLDTKNAVTKTADKAREQGFHLILSLLENSVISKQTLQPYCLKFKKTADLVRKNQKERARIQSIALDCLQAILVKFGPTLGALELDANNLYWEILRDSEKCSFQPTVRGKMFQTLGIIARLFATGFMDKPSTYNQLFNHLINSMKAQIDSKNHHMEAAILLGTVKGLDEFLSAFEAKITQRGNPKMLELYEQLEQIIDPKCSIEHDKATLKLKRREFQRAGLDLIANHGSIFQQQLYLHYEQWFMDLLSWAKSNNMDDLRAGMKALSKFLKVICSYIHEKKLEEEASEASDPVSIAAASFREKLINFFTTTFRVILDNKDCHKSELSISIQGIGLLVDVCDDAGLKDHLFAKILKHVELIISEFNMPERDKYSRAFSLIPSYLESLGNMLISMKISDEGSLLTFQSRLGVIEQLCGVLVAHYPDMGEKYKAICPYSFLKVLRSLYSAHFRWAQPFLENIVGEGLREIISCPTQVEVDILIESYQRANASQGQGQGATNPEKQRKAVATKLGLRTLHSFLPFWIQLVNGGNDVSVGEYIYDAVIQWALLTIARLDLSIEFLEEEDEVDLGAAEETSVHPIANTKANTARDFQLFVNLVEFLQEFMNQTPPHYFERRWTEIFLSTMLKYVDSHPFVSGFYKLVALGFEMMRKIGYFDNMIDPVVNSVFQQSSDLLKSLAAGVQEHRDDLLLSVLRIWLSAPNQLILANLQGLGITLRIIFQTGRTCFPIAMQAAEAVERWFEMKDFPIETVEKLFNELFPIWKSYFTTCAAEPENSETTLNKTIAAAKFSTKRSKKGSRRRQARSRPTGDVDTTLNALQLRILQLIGSYGHYLDVDADADGGSRKDKMSTEDRFLKYAIPFQDIKPDLYLDSILPRVLELCAEGGSERQVRSSACECFHSLALYFLGHSVHSSTRESHPELFSRIFTAMLKLGSDSDSVVRQLFNPFTIQVIHWYTRGGSGQVEGEIILRTIMDSLAQSEDSALRDFAAVAISEYFSWSLKHSDTEKVKMITKTLSAMSTHAAPKYRQGSVLAFNSIYREFRENDQLVNTYTFLFTYSYLVSLGLPSEFGNESILIKSTRQGLRHLERIILKKKTQFNIPLRGRKLPVEFGGGECLVHLVDWMMGHSVKAEMIGRDEALRLVSTLAPNIRDMGSLEAYLYKYQEGKDLVAVFENFPIQSEESMDLDLDFDSFQSLLKSLTVAADLYDFFATSGSGGISLVAKFLKSTNSKFIQWTGNMLNCSSDFFAKCPSLSFRFFIKLGGILQNSNTQLFDSKFRGDFLRSSMELAEFVTSSRETNLLKLAQIYSVLFPSFELGNSELKRKICSVFNLSLTDEMDVVTMAKLCKTLEWFQVLAASKFLHKLLGPGEIKEINEKIWIFIESKLFDPIKGEMKRISLRMEELVQSLLIFALQIGIGGNKIVDAAFDPVLVISKGRGNVLQKLKKGEVFQRALLPALCHCEELLDFKKLTDSVSIEQIGLLAQSLLNAVRNQRGLRKKFGTKLVAATLAIWRQLHLNCDPQIIAKIISGLASLNMEMCRSSVQLSEWWGGSKMMTSSHLTLAEKSEFIHFFPLFALSKNSAIVDTVIGSMEEFVTSSVHLEPRKGPAGVPAVKWSQEENYFLQFFLKLIAVYEEIPQNLKLLQVLVKFTTKACQLSQLEAEVENENEAEKPKSGIKENPCANEMRKTLEKVVEKNNAEGNESVNITMANCVLKLILDDKILDCGPGTKFALVPILASMTEKSAQKFFIENIRLVIKLIESPASTLKELKIKTTGFCIVEMLALKTSNKFIRGPLPAAYLEQLQKEGGAKPVAANDQALVALKTILGACQSMRKISIPSLRDEKLKAAHYSCHASAFNALAAILKAAECSVEHYTGFIFVDKTGTGALPGGVWSNLIDSTATYTFPVILEAGAKKISTEKAEGNIVNAQEKAANAPAHVTLPESSLASDASKYDFTSAVKVGTNEFYRLLHVGGPLGGGSAFGAYTDPKQFLEWNAVNEHECMLALVQTIQHMKTFKYKDSNPRWIQELVAQFQRPNIHANVKGFLIGAILNCEEVIQPYAQYFVEPIIATILNNSFPTSGSGSTNLGSSGSGTSESLNHFVKDIIVMLLSWLGKEPGAKPSKLSARKLMEFYIKRIEFSRNDVFQHNLQILQTMAKEWVYPADAEGELPIPYEMIEDRLDKSDQRVGLHICQAILLGNQLPCPIEKLPAFIDRVSRGFKSTIKSVYALAGEVSGLMLKYLDRIQYGFLEEAMVRLKDKKLGKEKGRVQPFLVMLNSIRTHFPPFLLKFKTELIGIVKLQPSVISLLVHVLRVELEKETEDKEKLAAASALVADLEGRGVFRTECKGPEATTSAVDLLTLLISTDFVKREVKVKLLVHWTQSAEQSADGTLRARYASAISAIYTHYGGHKTGSEISSKTEKMFIRLYSDQDQEVQDVVNEFWSKNLRSWTKSPALILELMETLGDDANALSVALDLILKRCSLAPDYGKMIFDKALADCPFVPYQLDTSWRLQNFSHQPLFAESLSSLAAAAGGMGGTMLPPALQSTLTQRKVSTQFGMNLLKATLNQYQFTPTQGNNSLGDQSQQPMEIDDSFENNRFPSQHAFEVPAVAEAQAGPSAPVRTLENLRRRFYERPEAYVFAQRTTERQHIAAETRIEDNRQKRSGVRMVRSYRIGELPDILIKHSELLLTISTLAKLDEELGKIFLVRLFTAIAQELGSAGSDSPRALGLFRHNSAIAFDKLFRTYGSQLSPKFAAAILEISLSNQIRLKVNLVSNISRSFELQVMGILKLEEEQESLAAKLQPQDSKRPRLDPDAGEGTSRSEVEVDIDVWLRIGELYKELDDFDTVRSVFFRIREMSQNENYFEKAREALYYESVGKYREALERYDDLYTEESEKSDPNILLVQFWDDGLYKVMASLADWSERYHKAHESYLIHADELNNENYRDRVLPNQIVSGLQVLLNDEDADENIEAFKSFLEKFRANDEDWKELVETFRVEFAMLSQIEEEPSGRTSALVDSAWAAALRAFQLYDHLSSPQRKAQILELQKISVLSETLDWNKVTANTTGEIEQRTTKLINKWHRSCSSTPTTTSLLAADFIITQRNHFLTKAGARIQDLREENSALLTKLKNLYFEQNLWVVQVAALHRNAEVGNGYLKKAKEAGENLRAKQLLLLAQLLTNCDYTQDIWSRQWTIVWRKIPRLNLGDPRILWKAQAELLRSVIVTAEKEPLDVECVDRLSHALSIPTEEHLLKAITQKSIELVGKATGEVSGFSTTIWDKRNSNSEENVSMTFFHLLKTILEKFPKRYGGDEGIHKRMLLSLIQAMKTGHSEALHFFPTCFPWLEKFPGLISTFEAHSKEIPSWMFLPWLDQIVTNWKHNPKLAAWLKPILMDRLVPDFPQAFQLQYTEFLTSSPLMVNYGKALGALVLPDILFKKRIQNLERKHTQGMLKAELEKLWQDLEGIRMEPEFYGRIHQDYVSEVQPKVKDKLDALDRSGEGEESNASQDMLLCQQVSTEISTLFKNSNTLRKNVYEPLNKRELKSFLNLKDLSPWLSKFHFAGFSEDLEIPGLFKHFKRPDPSSHSKIVSFEPTVQVYKSLTKPIGLRMMANNGKKYQFLVKYGDDLRQDKRIQQLFDLTNEILSKDPHCRQRALSIRTYSVIPISRELGLIEIVGKTISLKKFIFNTRARETTYDNSAGAYLKWINFCAGQGVDNVYHKYGKVAMKERSQVESQFDKVVATVPPKLFKNNVQSSTETVESYFQVRTTLIRSCATMSLTHWLLGIGDRHLDNCLISLERGEFLGIDFGMAFGAGAVSIDVPELIPFRLTPQIQEFLAPYGIHGLFKETMMFTWRTILKSAGVLAAVAEVFVKEPTVTWARKGSGSGIQGSTLPIDVLKQKLGGGNPIMILGRLLQQQRNKNYLGQWVQVAEDGRGENTFKEKLTDEELIDLLLGLATDKNILGRTYVGWSPWV